MPSLPPSVAACVSNAANPSLHVYCRLQERGPQLCCAVLDTLTALVAGSPANRRALG